MLASVAVLGLAIGCGGQSPAAGNPNNNVENLSYQQVVDEYFAGYFAYSPERASGVGEHSRDHEWSDVSAEALRKYSAWLDAMAEKLAIERAGLSIDQEVDLKVLLNRVRRAQVSLRVDKHLQTNPLAYA